MMNLILDLILELRVKRVPRSRAKGFKFLVKLTTIGIKRIRNKMKVAATVQEQPSFECLTDKRTCSSPIESWSRAGNMGGPLKKHEMLETSKVPPYIAGRGHANGSSYPRYISDVNFFRDA